MVRKLISIMLALTIALFLSGCAGGSDKPELGQVNGTVTMDGDPLANVVVTFNPKDGRPATAETDKSGNFTLSYLGEPGAKVGKHVVSINTPPPDDGDSGSCGCDEPEEGGFVEPIPLRYNANAADNPEMNVEVKPGPNNFSFNLTSEGPKATGSGCDGCGNVPCG